MNSVNEDRFEKNIREWSKYDHLSQNDGMALLLGVIPNEDVIAELNNFVVFSPNHRLLWWGIELLSGMQISPIPPRHAIERNDEIGGGNPWQFCADEEIEEAAQAAQQRLSAYEKRYKRLLKIWDSGKHPDLTPLSYFIEWAKSKDECPQWLPLAEKLGLVSATENGSREIAEKPLAPRAETTYLNIIAALLECIAGNLPGVAKHPTFESEAKLIALIDERYKGIGGLSASTLSRKFPEAKRSLAAS